MSGRYDLQVEEALGLSGVVPSGDHHGHAPYVHVESAFAEAARSIEHRTAMQDRYQEDEDLPGENSDDEYEAVEMGRMARNFEAATHPDSVLRKEEVARMYRRDGFVSKKGAACVLCQYVLPLDWDQNKELTVMENLFGFYEKLVCNRGFDAANNFFAQSWNNHMNRVLTAGTSECRTINESIVHNHFKPDGCGPKLPSVILSFDLANLIELSTMVYDSGVYLKDVGSVGQKKMITSDKSITSLLKIGKEKIHTIALIQTHVENITLGKRSATDLPIKRKKLC